MSALDGIAAVVSDHPEVMERFGETVRTSAAMYPGNPTDRAAGVGDAVVTALKAEASGVSLAVLNTLLDDVDLVEIGQHYIDLFDWQCWSRSWWTDLPSVPDEAVEEMREELLAVRDQHGFDYPDEEAVFAYLEDGDNELPGGFEDDWSALEVARLWQRRYQASFDSWEEVADSWLDDHDPDRLWETFRGLAGKSQAEVVDELKNKLGRAIAAGEDPVLHYIDRLASHGDLLCLKRRDS